MKRNGFTLVELMVAGAIGLVLGLTLPAVARSREMARRANCISNLKQIGLGTAIYSAGSNWSAMPASLADNGILQTGAGKDGADAGVEWGLNALWDLGDGVNNDPNVFLCPSADPGITPDISERLLRKRPMEMSGARFKQSGYSMSWNMTVEDMPNKVLAGDKLRGSSVGVAKQARNDSDEYSFVVAGARKPFDVDDSTLMNSISGNHRTEGANLLFMDGHVKWYNVRDWDAGAPRDGSENNMRRQNVYALQGDAAGPFRTDDGGWSRADAADAANDTWMQ